MAKRIDPKIKAACIAAVMGGLSLRKVAEAYGVDHVAIKRWVDLERAKTTPLTPDVARAREQIELELNAYILDSLRAMRAHVNATANETWVNRQSGSDLAQFHKTLAENVGRVVAAEQERGLAEESPTPIAAYR